MKSFVFLGLMEKSVSHLFLEIYIYIYVVNVPGLSCPYYYLLVVVFNHLFNLFSLPTILHWCGAVRLAMEKMESTFFSC